MEGLSVMRAPSKRATPALGYQYRLEACYWQAETCCCEATTGHSEIRLAQRINSVQVDCKLV